MNHGDRIAKRGGLWLAFAAIGLLVLAAWGCTLDDLVADLSDVLKQTTLVIELEPPEGAKIILPSMDLEASLYDIAGTGPDGESFSVTDHSSSQYTRIGLTPGPWTLSATAKNAVGDALGYSAEVIATLVQAKTTSTRLSCLPLDGTGGLAMNLSWPAGAMSEPNFHAVMTSSSGAERTIAMSTDYSSATIAGPMSFSQGAYDLEVRMSDGSFGPEPVWTKFARVFIAQGKTTTVNWVMDPSEMMLRPGVRTFAGGNSGLLNGTGTHARFDWPSDIVMDYSGNLYVADANNHCIRKISPAGVVSTLAGSGTAGFQDGLGAGAAFNQPSAIAISGDTALYVADTGNHAIRKVTISNGTVITIAGTGTAGSANSTSGILAQFDTPKGILVLATYIYVADTLNHTIRRISSTSPYAVTTFSGTADSPGWADGNSANALFNQPGGLSALPEYSSSFVVADTNNHRIRRVDSSGNVFTLAGSASGSADGTGSLAAFNAPRGVAPGPDGCLYIADTGNNRIRRMSHFNEVTTIAGSGIALSVDGEALEASFYYPRGLSVDPEGRIFVAERTGCKIRVILP